MQRKRANQTASCTYQCLESRQLLAAIVYVDFGFNAGEHLAISDAQSASLNGPQVFGSGSNLSTFASDVSNGEIDFNRDGEINLADAEFAAQWITFQVSEIFEPFDVNVVQVTAANVAEIQATLQQNPSTNDAYVFVSGGKATMGGQVGAGIVDPGNTQDNFSVVFAGKILETVQYRFQPIHPVAWKISRAVARYTGHSFGLATVEASEARSAIDVMAGTGTDASGQILPDVSANSGPYVFTRWDLNLKQLNGTSAGIQNAYDILAANVGANTNGTQYFTGLGNTEVITVTTGSLPNTFDLDFDGVVVSNVDATNGVEIEAGERLEFNGIFDDEFGITYRVAHDLPGSVTVKAGHLGQLEVTSGPTDWLFDGSFTGSVNGNINFEGMFSAVSGDFNDTFEILAGGAIRQLDANGGRDTLTTREGYLKPAIVDLGGGDDNFHVYGFDLKLSGFSTRVDGGQGFDSLFEHRDDVFSGGRFTDNGIDGSVSGGGFRNFDHIDLSDSANNFFSNGQSGSNVRAVIKDDVATFFDADTNAKLAEVISPKGLRSANILLLNTNRPLNLVGGTVTISSSVDVQQSDLSTIVHAVGVSATNTRIFKRVGEPVVVNIQGRNIEGLAPAIITINREVSSFNKSTALHLTDGNDRVTYDTSQVPLSRHSSFNEPISVYAHAGDDVMQYSRIATGTNQLARLDRPQFFHGGEGNDRVLVDDSDSKFPSNFRITDKHIDQSLHNRFLNNYRDIDSRHNIIRYRETEIVRVHATPYNDIIDVEASDTTRFFLDGKGGQDQFNTSQTNIRQTVATELGGGHVNYDAELKIIEFRNMERQATSGRFVLGTDHGQIKSTVKVHDSTTNQFLFEIQAYADDFRGGVRVSTANINDDLIPDIIVAPGIGQQSESIVKVFDGENGELIGSFQAHAGYRGGFNVAAGNLTRDAGNEIAVVNSSNRPVVQVFAFDETTGEFTRKKVFRPFDSGYSKGASIAVGDMNLHQQTGASKFADGRDEIVLGSTSGRILVVDSRPQTPVVRHSFLSGLTSNQGAVEVAIGQFNDFNFGTTMTQDIVVGSGQVPNSAPTAGMIRIFDGADLNDTSDDILEPLYERKILDSGSSVTLATPSPWLGGNDDFVFVSQRGTIVSKLRKLNISTDQVIEINLRDEIFAQGVNLG